MQTSEENVDPLVLHRRRHPEQATCCKTDIERLTACYYDHGYITVRVDEPKVERDDDGLNVTIKIDEGEQFRVGKVELRGRRAADDPSSTTELSTSKHRRDLPREHAARGHPEADRPHGDDGYAFANVEPETEIDPEEKIVDITFQVEHGPPVTIDRIEITGNTKTRDKVIRREMQGRRSRSSSPAPSCARAATRCSASASSRR